MLGKFISDSIFAGRDMIKSGMTYPELLLQTTQRPWESSDWWNVQIQTESAAELDCLCRDPRGVVSVLIDYKFFSWCFINQYLVLLPFGLFTLALLVRLYSISRQTSIEGFSKSARRWDFWAKFGLSLAQIILLLVAEAYQNYYHLFAINGWTSAVTIASFALVFAIQTIEPSKQILPSDSVLWYWLVFLVSYSLKLGHIAYHGYFSYNLPAALLETFIFVNGTIIFLRKLSRTLC